MPVRNEGTGISRRPKIAPLPVTWPSPLTPVKWPLTLARPQKFLILKLTVERSGSRLHTPAVSGSFSSVSTFVMCATPPHRCVPLAAARLGVPPLHRRGRASCAPLLLCRLAHYRREFRRVEILIDTSDQGLRTRRDTRLDNDAHPQRDQSASCAGRVQDVLLHETVREQLPVEDLVAALGGDPDEPPQDPQRPLFVVVATRAGPPHRDVVVEQLNQSCLVAALDCREQFVGQGDDDLGSGHGGS